MAERGAERAETLLTRVRALEQAIGETGTTLDETNTCRELAAFAARHLGAATAVDLAAEPGAPLRRAAHAEPTTSDPEPVDPSGGTPAAHTRPLAPPAAHQLSVPLAVHDETPLGAVTLSRTGGGPFSGDEAALLRPAARLAARLPADSGPGQVVDEVLRRLGAHGAEDDVAVLAARIRARAPR